FASRKPVKIKNPEPRFDSIETETALAAMAWVYCVCVATRVAAGFNAAARLGATGLAAGFAVVVACAGALSQPPAGAATLIASSGCGSGVKVWIASLAAASDWASR